MFQGKTLTITTIEAGLVELHFDNTDKPVNVFNRATVAELGMALDVLEKAPGIQGMLVTSGKKVFVAGADITEFETAFTSSKEELKGFLWANNSNLNRLETLPFPVVVAINGFALGGGFEFCLACDFRVMASVAQVGFPEVGLGILPGWGGTVRAPRMVEFAAAVEWVTGGGQHKAADALAQGFVDAVVSPESLREEALSILRQAMAGELDYRALRLAKQGALDVDQSAFAETASTLRAAVVRQAGKHYPAPVAAVDAMIQAAPLTRDQALDVEFDAFYQLAQSPQARALIGLFMADQQLSAVARKYASASPAPAARVAVLGAGIMGGGIAYQNALKGFSVLMKDINQAALDLGMKEAGTILSKRVERGAMTEDAAAKVLSSIEPTLDYDDIAGCDMIIEAVVEKEVVKKAVLAEVEKLVPSSTVLASNTSSILITSIATALERPENFCGMHFFNPVHAMPLVEVVRGEKTSDETVARAVAHVLAMGKKAVVVKDCNGFLVNRVLFPYFAGFNLLMRDGADFEQIDRVMEDWGWPMGPAYLLDVIGIDVAVHAADVVAEGYPDRLTMDFAQASHLMYENKRFGQKNGKGFYAYERNDKGRTVKVSDPETWTLLAPHVAPRREFSDEEIIARMMIPMCTEMVRCLDEEITGSPAEGDMSLLYGIGFPKFRGGVLRWLDEIGLSAFCTMADRYSHLGGLYQPTQSMRDMALGGKRYY
ncbi:MAG: multifunctional fatty acid oxidation complex subunit alpha [Gammaproteobacteria bacterium BRH_c0]|nr:MAG: multifunctional fatty acid oxidation complex subunit alpha [Gammaproteobacteria bacterium BRH_c0]